MNQLENLTNSLNKISERHDDLMNCMSTLNKGINKNEPFCYVGPFGIVQLIKNVTVVKKFV